MMKTVCLLLGGLDTSLSATLAKSEGYVNFVLHLDYRQRTQFLPGALAVAGNHDHVENVV